jgi:hypothetical protein
MRAACLSALSILALPAFADTPLERALAAPSDGPAYKFELSIDGDTLKGTAEVDPTRPEGERLTLLSPSEEELSDAGAEMLADLKAKTKGDKIWCSDFAGNIPADAKLISESGEAAVYSFRPLPGEDDETPAKVYKHLTGRVTVSKETPSILAFEMFAEKPFKPALAAKVDTFSMKVGCATAPDGRTYMRDFSLDLSGSALMQPFSQTERRQITRLVALPDAELASGQR